MRPDLDPIAAWYRHFAEQEARGASPLYEALALGVASDPPILERLAALPPARRQPNLLLAAARHVAGVQPGWPAFRQALLAEWDAIRAVMLARSTQTNEPGRCATLLPVLAHLPQPLALIEVGAAAGLCLLPDRYTYAFNGRNVPPDGTPVFPCDADAATPLPTSLPNIVWRAGLDLNPLDVHDAAQMAWLETLVWPEQQGRLARLRAAVEVARANPPHVVSGDLRQDLAALAAEAPRDATLVIFHTAVLAYLPEQREREAFAASVVSMCDYWIANESPRVFPAIAAKTTRTAPPGHFLLSVNGSPVAWTHPHGAAIQWIAPLPLPNRPQRGPASQAPPSGAAPHESS